MSRPRFVFIGLLTIVFGCAESRKAPNPPNIIVILSDDQGWGDLSITGNTSLSTPNIDRIGHEGALLDRFYVSPVCSPTRAEFLTGRYHSRMGVYSTSAGGERMDAEETTIAEVFREAGYATAAFGKWHNGMQYPYHPNARGFEEYYGFCSGHWGDYYSPPLEHNGELVQGKGYLTDDFTDHALDFIRSHRDQPFFLYLAYNSPHSPMQAPDKWWNNMKSRDLKQFAGEGLEEDTMFTKAALAMCENIDWNVGRILERLKTDQLEENTIILYFSDNGPNSWRWNAGFKGRKGSIHEGGVRSPLLIRYPGVVPEGLKISTLAGAIDLLPTLADLAGIKNTISKPLDGISIKDYLTGKRAPEDNDRYIYSHWNGKTSIRDQRYLFTHNGELYDIGKDPGQKNELSASAPDITSRLSRLLTQWEQTVGLGKEAAPRPFTVGHPDAVLTQLPARDGTGHGGILRSNRYPNASFFTHWTRPEDKITWDIEVLESGTFDVDIYYTCPEEDLGAVVELSMNDNRLQNTITEAHDPPLSGMENDLVERTESYVKDFKKMNMGPIRLNKGTGTLELKALEIPGGSVMDFRLLVLRRIRK